MAKWADKLIFEVHFNQARTHIERVRYHLDNVSNVHPCVLELSRDAVISEIKGGTTFATIVRDSGGQWIFGAKVGVFPVNGVEYIKTKPDASRADNLDNLPEF